MGPVATAGAADNIKKWRLPQGNFLHNFLQQQRAIVNCMAVNQDGVVATGRERGEACVGGGRSAWEEGGGKEGQPASFVHQWLLLLVLLLLSSAGADNGSLWMWDWTSGNCFQQQDSIVQPGSLESEAGIYACAFDISGSRFVTCEVTMCCGFEEGGGLLGVGRCPGRPVCVREEVVLQLC